MILGIGIDIIEIERIKNAIEKSDKFLEKVFTKKENAYFESRNSRFEVVAGNFAAKEAVAKALGVGFRNFEWQDVEILRDLLGKPYAVLHNNAKLLMDENCILHVSISHCKEYAVANAVLEKLNQDICRQSSIAFEVLDNE